MKAAFKIPHTKSVQKAIKALGPRVLKSAASSLYTSFEEVMSESKDIYCPVDTSNLRSTGRVDLPEVTKTDVKVRMGYGGTAGGGEAVNYAIPVHEINKNYNNGKQWKYLETPLKKNLKNIERNLGEDLKEDAASLSTETLA